MSEMCKNCVNCDECDQDLDMRDECMRCDGYMYEMEDVNDDGK